MIAIWAIVVVLFGHWLFDFVGQPDWMAMRKSKEWWVLTQHALRITIGSAITALAIVLMAKHSHPEFLTYWAIINGVGHFAIDAVTSRITSKLYAKGDIHNFFVVIGFDQFLHMTLAVSTLYWLVS